MKHILNEAGLRIGLPLRLPHLRPLLLGITVVIGLTACGGSNDSPDDPTNPSDGTVDGGAIDGGNGGDGDTGGGNGDDGNAGGGNGDDGSAGSGAYAFDVTITNSMAAQPLSPMALITHSEDYQIFFLGQSASVPLEELSEGGSNQAFLAEAEGSEGVLSTVSGEGEILPGTSSTLRIQYTPSGEGMVYLAGVSMLVNTNDAIMAWQRIPISSLAVNETKRFVAFTYDTGTELNTETAETIPGPAAGGEGFAEERDDIIDAVLVHPSVVTADDGLSTSALSGIHKWDHPSVSVQIQRVQ